MRMKQKCIIIEDKRKAEEINHVSSQRSGNDRIVLKVSIVVLCLAFIAIILTSTYVLSHDVVRLSYPGAAPSSNNSNATLLTRSIKSDYEPCVLFGSEVICSNIHVNTGEVVADYISRNGDQWSSDCYKLTIRNCFFPENTVKYGWLPNISTSFIIMHLHITNCVPTTIEEDSFNSENFKNMNYLTLENSIAHLRKNCFAGLRHLQTLDIMINGNTLYSVHSGILDDVPNLTTLQITSEIKYEDLNSFLYNTNLEKLQTLGINNNNLHQLNSSILDGLPNLLKLDVVSSNLKYIEASTFSAPASKIQQINLSNNKLESLQTGTFNIKSYRTNFKVFLDKNNLKTLPEGIFEKATLSSKEVAVTLAYNDWICDCSLAWLQEYIISGRIQLDDDPKCASPEINENKSFKDADFNTCITELPTEITESPTEITELPTEITEPPTEITESPTISTEITNSTAETTTESTTDSSSSSTTETTTDSTSTTETTTDSTSTTETTADPTSTTETTTDSTSTTETTTDSTSTTETTTDSTSTTETTTDSTSTTESTTSTSTPTTTETTTDSTTETTTDSTTETTTDSTTDSSTSSTTETTTDSTSTTESTTSSFTPSTTETTTDSTTETTTESTTGSSTSSTTDSTESITYTSTRPPTTSSSTTPDFRDEYEYINCTCMSCTQDNIRVLTKKDKIVLSSLKFNSIKNFEIVEDDENKKLKIQIKASVEHLLIWMNTDDTSTINCNFTYFMKENRNSLTVLNAEFTTKPNTSYTVCVISEEVTISPLNCRAYTTLPNEGDRPWLVNNQQIMIWAIFCCAMLLSIIVGGAIIFTVVKRNPRLIRGNKRVIVVSHRAGDVMIMPKEYYFGTGENNTMFRRPSEASYYTARTSNTSYVTAIQPTPVQLIAWKFNRMWDKLIANGESDDTKKLSSPNEPPPLPPYPKDASVRSSCEMNFPCDCNSCYTTVKKQDERF